MTGTQLVHRTKMRGLVEGSRFSSIAVVAKGGRSCNDLAKVLYSDINIFFVVNSRLGCGDIRTDRRHVSNSNKLDGISICTSYCQQQYCPTCLFGASGLGIYLFFKPSEIFQNRQRIHWSELPSLWVGSNFNWCCEFSVVGFLGRRTCLGNMVGSRRGYGLEIVT